MKTSTLRGLISTQLNGWTFGIVGLREIGRVVAAIGNGFGCKAIADDSHADPQRA
jgi:lactate dehydrogenase-like 2-hydroxyacid dehydrogenase